MLNQVIDKKEKKFPVEQKDKTIKVTATRHQILKKKADKKGMTLTKYIEAQFNILDGIEYYMPD